jgi:hypothetical protein
VRVILNAVCGCTAAACLWLAVMFVVLHRPGFERGLVMSLLFVGQSLFALAVLNQWISGRVWRVLALAGSAAIAWAGANAFANTLNRPHFEGFTLLIGAALALQGLLTGHQLITSRFTPSSKVHRFGN